MGPEEIPSDVEEFTRDMHSDSPPTNVEKIKEQSEWWDSHGEEEIAEYMRNHIKIIEGNLSIADETARRSYEKSLSRAKELGIVN